MSNIKVSRYCRIIDYLDAIGRTDLTSLLRATCTDVTLSSTKGKNGITFLVPDKAYTKEIIKDAESDDPAIAARACDKINALILRDVFYDKNDFDARMKRDKDYKILNSLFESQHLEVKITPSGVELGGCKIKPDTAFKDKLTEEQRKDYKQRRRGLAVWNIESGQIGLNNPVHKYEKKIGKFEGAYEASDANSRKLRSQIAIAVENSFVYKCRDGKGGFNPFIKASLGLFCHIYSSDKHLAYDRVIPVMSCDNSDFYFMVEPHKMSGDYLIPDSVIEAWWHQHRSCDCKSAFNMLQSAITNAPSEFKKYAIYGDRLGLQEEINKVRKSLYAKKLSRPRECVDDIAHVYDTLCSTNAIGNKSNVFPPGIINLYRSEQGLKMLQDDMRFLLFNKMKSLCEDSHFDAGAYNELFNRIGDCLFAGSEADRATQSHLLNKNRIKYMITPNEMFAEVHVFLMSTMFLYVPMTESDASNLKGKCSVTRPQPNENIIFNVHDILCKNHNRVIDAHHSGAPKLLSLLKSTDVAKLDQETLDEIRRLLA